MEAVEEEEKEEQKEEAKSEEEEQDSDDAELERLYGMGRNANVKAGVQFEDKKGKNKISDRVFDESSGDDDSDDGDDVFVKNPSKSKK